MQQLRLKKREYQPSLESEEGQQTARLLASITRQLILSRSRDRLLPETVELFFDNNKKPTDSRGKTAFPWGNNEQLQNAELHGAPLPAPYLLAQRIDAAAWNVRAFLPLLTWKSPASQLASVSMAAGVRYDFEATQEAGRVKNLVLAHLHDTRDRRPLPQYAQLELMQDMAENISYVGDGAPVVGNSWSFVSTYPEAS